MMGHPTWSVLRRVATRINEIESHVHLTQCHGHTLQLAVGDNL